MSLRKISGSTLLFSALLFVAVPLPPAEAQDVDVDVPGNLTMHDSADATVGNLLKEGAPFLHNFGTDNTFLGSGAGNFTMSGRGDNTAIGTRSLMSNRTGVDNTATGAFALRSNTTGNGNTASGTAALRDNTTGQLNTAVGLAALELNTTGVENTAIGLALLSNTTGNDNTAVGVQALGLNSTGNLNTAVGVRALYANLTGAGNTAIGVGALEGNLTGDNTAVGYHALFNNVTGSNNTAIGDRADVPAFSNLSNATAIGAGAIVDASNKIRLGDPNVTLIEAQGDFHAAGPGNGIILKSPDGLTCARLSIDNSGQLITTGVKCP